MVSVQARHYCSILQPDIHLAKLQLLTNQWDFSHVALQCVFGRSSVNKDQILLIHSFTVFPLANMLGIVIATTMVNNYSAIQRLC